MRLPFVLERSSFVAFTFSSLTGFLQDPDYPCERGFNDRVSRFIAEACSCVGWRSKFLTSKAAVHEKNTRYNPIPLLIASSLFAQSVSGNLEGWVESVKGGPVISANVSVASPNLLGVRGAATDSNGHFQIFALSPGVYTVRIKHISY